MPIEEMIYHYFHYRRAYEMPAFISDDILYRACSKHCWRNIIISGNIGRRLIYLIELGERGRHSIIERDAAKEASAINAAL